MGQELLGKTSGSTKETNEPIKASVDMAAAAADNSKQRQEQNFSFTAVCCLSKCCSAFTADSLSA